MKKSKKELALLAIKIITLFSLCLLILVSGHVYITIGELKLKINEQKIAKSYQKKRTSLLERDTSVKKDDLYEFLEFSSSVVDTKDLVEKEAIFIEKDKIYLNQKLELEGLYENSCSRFNCIQIKTEFHQIPSSIWKGLLGTEDFRFLEHRGVDVIAIARAIVVDLIAMRFVQGGSTLTQQLMKNIFLTNERSISRKIKEMIYALYIENIMEKEQILTLYLNEVYWGSFQGIYIKGYYGASLAYFGKRPSDLTDFEATVLISLLKGPNYYSPRKGVSRLRQRAQAVFNRLKSIELISKDENLWIDKQWEMFRELYLARSNMNHFKTYYFVSQNREQVLEPFEKFVFYKSVEKVNEALKSRTNQADIGIKALIANTECNSFECENLFSYYNKFEREKRAAITDEAHQIGSLLKPIVYDSFIELGRSYNEVVSTSPLTLMLKSGPWTPKDYSKSKEDSVSLKVALQKSKNIPLIRIANEVGFDKLENILLSRIPRMKTPLGEYPAQLLGALELTMEEVFKTYTRFIKDRCEDISNNKLKLENSVLYYMSVSSETTISKLATGPLKNAYIFGKTGTSNKGLDNWYFAFDGKQVYVIWYGAESKRNEHDLRLSGAVSSFQIFQNFINFRGKQISEIYCE